MFSFLPRLGMGCIGLCQAVCIFSRCEEGKNGGCGEGEEGTREETSEEEGRNRGCGEGEEDTREGTSEEEGRSRGCGKGEGGTREGTSEEEGKNGGCGEGEEGTRRFESHRFSFSQLRHGCVSGCG